MAAISALLGKKVASSESESDLPEADEGLSEKEVGFEKTVEFYNQKIAARIEGQAAEDPSLMAQAP